MKLEQYLTTNKLSPEAFGLLVDASESGVRKWMYGERTPRPKQMRRIIEVTKGKVSANDFITAEATA